MSVFVPLCVTLGAATVDSRTQCGVAQAGAGGAAHLVDASKEGQFARDDADVRLEAKCHEGIF